METVITINPLSSQKEMDGRFNERKISHSRFFPTQLKLEEKPANNH